MVILGLGFTDHEASAALIIDGRVSAAIARERLTRIKRDGKLWGSGKLDLDIAVEYCLQTQGLTPRDVDLIVWSHIDHLSALRLTMQLMAERSKGFFGRPILPLPHHFAHACCAFYLSPFQESAILIADGRGGPIEGLKRNCAGPEPEAVSGGRTIIQDISRESLEDHLEVESFYYCDGQSWTSLRKIVGGWKDGIGGRYGRVSELLFGDTLDSGKTMGLAPYGIPGSQQPMLERLGPADLPMFKATRGPAWAILKEHLRTWRGVREPQDYTVPLSVGVAATVQEDAEKALLTHARWLRQKSKSSNLCLAGGVALNCVANSRIAQECGFENIFIPSAPGDDGIALGCALYGAALHGQLHYESSPVFLGRSYSHDPEEIKALGMTPAFTTSPTEAWIAQKIAEGCVVAWYQGGAELGPRALGHRSFLADPRDPDMRDYLNKVVKRRETFRPFAPVVLEEAVLDFFEQHHPSYFMSFVATVRPEKRSQLRAVTHIDGTARYQVLQRSDNPQLDALIRAFRTITGVPMLLNTSFNRAGEPIVETPEEAVRCALASSADYLVLDGLVYAPG